RAARPRRARRLRRCARAGPRARLDLPRRPPAFAAGATRARAVPGRAVMQRRGRGLRARSLAQAAHVAYVSRAMGSVLKFFRALSGAGERRTFTARPPSTFSFPLFFV